MGKRNSEIRAKTSDLCIIFRRIRPDIWKKSSEFPCVYFSNSYERSSSHEEKACDPAEGRLKANYAMKIFKVKLRLPRLVFGWVTVYLDEIFPSKYRWSRMPFINNVVTFSQKPEKSKRTYLNEDWQSLWFIFYI